MREMARRQVMPDAFDVIAFGSKRMRQRLALVAIPQTDVAGVGLRSAQADPPDRGGERPVIVLHPPIRPDSDSAAHAVVDQAGSAQLR